MSDWTARATAWMQEDPDPETRAQTAAWLAADDRVALDACFGRRLEFGTAGLRGALGPGPNRMNRATVRRVTAGLAAWIHRSDVGDGPVVVGHDARHGSEAFAEDTARVLRGAGLSVVRFAGVVPTPLVAFAVRQLGARAGVMVTASHNPPGDNGYKVYWDHGGQIVPPHDLGISSAIEAIGSLDAVPLGDAGEILGPEVLDAYVAAVLGLRVHRPSAPIRVAYTPLHGVGRDVLLRVLRQAGYEHVFVEPSQGEPDGDFPTVAFPNPEEPGALDRVLALASEVDADLVLANDPDADRIAVAVRAEQGWRLLSGNDVGCLLAEDLLAHSDPAAERLVATTVVSSRLLSAIASHHGAAYAETLTGFKWIAQAARSFTGEFVLGYEEALGVCAGSVVRDKDGISAALLICDLAATHHGGLLDALDRLHTRHGVHAATQRSVKAAGDAGREQFQAAMAGLRQRPPTAIAGRAVRAVEDGLTGASGREPSDLLGFVLDGGRVLVRPSGTEPKLKVYAEAIVDAGNDLVAARRDATAAAAAMAEDLVATWLSP